MKNNTIEMTSNTNKQSNIPVEDQNMYDKLEKMRPAVFAILIVITLLLLLPYLLRYFTAVIRSYKALKYAITDFKGPLTILSN